MKECGCVGYKLGSEPIDAFQHTEKSEAAHHYTDGIRISIMQVFGSE